MKLDSYYIGTVEVAFEPESIENLSRYQYEYQVLVTLDNYAQVSVRTIRGDKYGNTDDFEDVILEPGARVTVMFPRGEITMGIIVHGLRQYPLRQDVGLGKHWRNRFNQVVRYIDKDGNYSVTSDQGPFLNVKTDQINLDDSVGEQIILDKTNKTLFINANDFTIAIKGNVNMTVDKDSTVAITGNSNINVTGNAVIAITGDLTASAKNITATAQENATINCKELNATASGNAQVTAAKIMLNGDGGDVLTTTTMAVIDSIFGELSIGVPTVSAG